MAMALRSAELCLDPADAYLDGNLCAEGLGGGVQPRVASGICGPAAPGTSPAGGAHDAWPGRRHGRDRAFAALGGALDAGRDARAHRMRRLHLLEVHEQPWCPAQIRDGATDCLRAIAGILQQYRAAVPLLQRALDATGSQQIIDLCSGGAGPWLRMGPQLQRRLRRRVPVVLTDLYPSWQSTVRDRAAATRPISRPVNRSSLCPSRSTLPASRPRCPACAPSSRPFTTLTRPRRRLFFRARWTRGRASASSSRHGAAPGRCW